jgi:hypothetical protein
MYKTSSMFVRIMSVLMVFVHNPAQNILFGHDPSFETPRTKSSRMKLSVLHSSVGNFELSRNLLELGLRFSIRQRLRSELGSGSSLGFGVEVKNQINAISTQCYLSCLAWGFRPGDIVRGIMYYIRIYALSNIMR